MGQASLFADPGAERRQQLMATLDDINQRWGKGTLRTAAEGMAKPWQMRRQRLSPRYTTDWEGLPVVVAG